MENTTDGLKFGTKAGRLADFALANFRRITIATAVLTLLAFPVRSSGQTLNLAPDSSSGIFVNGGELNVLGGTVNGNVQIANNSAQMNVLSNSVINGNTQIGNNTGQFNLLSSTINGNVQIGSGVATSIDNPASISGGASTPSAGVSVTAAQTTLPQADYTPPVPPGDLDPGAGPLNFAAGGSGVTVFNISGEFDALGTTLNLSGSSTDTLIFDVYGINSSNIASGLTFTDVTMNLSGGLLASNVIFYVANGNANIVDSIGNTYGTFYTNSANTSTDSGNINIEDSSVMGTLVAGNDGVISIDSGSVVTSNSFVSPTPEMPTIMTAGLAAVLLVAGSFFDRLRRKNPASPRALAG